jgi:hypothetical protein
MTKMSNEQNHIGHTLFCVFFGLGENLQKYPHVILDKELNRVQSL